jgi:hypothetical protein
MLVDSIASLGIALPLWCTGQPRFERYKQEQSRPQSPHPPQTCPVAPTPALRAKIIPVARPHSQQSYSQVELDPSSHTSRLFATIRQQVRTISRQ